MSVILPVSSVPVFATSCEKNTGELLFRTQYFNSFLKKSDTTVPRGQVNEITRDQFRDDFAMTPEKWKRSDHYDEAVFMKDRQQYVAYYDFNSNLVGTTTVKEFSDLPRPGQKNIKEEYSGYKIGPVILFHDYNITSDGIKAFWPEYRFANNYFVELMKGKDKILVQVNPQGDIYFFRDV